jgi:hypothetical protein
MTFSGESLKQVIEFNIKVSRSRGVRDLKPLPVTDPVIIFQITGSITVEKDEND